MIRGLRRGSRGVKQCASKRWSAMINEDDHRNKKIRKKTECAEYFYLLDNVQSNPHCCKYSPCLNLFTTKAVCQVLVQIRGFCRWKSFLKDNKGKCATTPCSAWCSAPKIFLRIFCSKPKYLTIFLFIILKKSCSAPKIL